MNACENVQAQLLPLVYDLVEPSERQVLEAHLEQCTSCRAALLKVQEQRQLLGEAAKAEFPDVRFTPPAAAPVRATLPSVKPTGPSKPVRHWSRWALAASIAVVLAGGAGFGLYGWHERSTQLNAAQSAVASARQTASDTRQTYDGKTQRSREEIRRIRNHLDELTKKWTDTDAKVRRNIAEKQAELVVTGPKHLQAGGRNEYKIEVKDAKRADVKGEPVEVRIVDPTSKEPLFKKQVKGGEVVTFDLPADLPLAPGVEPLLEVSAKLDGQEVRLAERVPLAPPIFLTHLATDRPMYRPGEVVHFRSLTLERFS